MKPIKHLLLIPLTFMFLTAQATAQNNPPVPTLSSFQAEEDAPSNSDFQVSATDSDNAQGELTFTLTQLPQSGSIHTISDPFDANDGVLALNDELDPAATYYYRGTSNYNGSDELEYTVSDGNESVAQTVSIEVAAVNDAPVASMAVPRGPEDKGFVITLQATDVDNSDANEDNHHPLVAQLVSVSPRDGGFYQYEEGFDPDDPSTFGAEITDASSENPVEVTDPQRRIIYLGAPDHNSDFNFPDTFASPNFTYNAKDQSLTSEPLRTSVVIEPVNDAPVITEETQTLTLDEETEDFSISLDGSDIDNTEDDLGGKITQMTLPEGAMLTTSMESSSAVEVGDEVPSTLYFIPDKNGLDEEPYAEFSYAIYDGNLASNEETQVTVNVASVNDAPENATPAFFILDTGESVDFELEGSDPEGDTYTVEIGTPPNQDNGRFFQLIPGEDPKPILINTTQLQGTSADGFHIRFIPDPGESGKLYNRLNFKFDDQKPNGESSFYMVTINIENEPFSGGNGTAEDPYQVAKPADLDSVRHYLDSHFIQTEDINMDVDPYNTAKGFNPIGAFSEDQRFSGTYDGDGHTISNLFSNDHVKATFGLFSSIEQAELKNIGLENVNINGVGQIGALAGFVFNSSINICYSTGSIISSGPNSGGLIGAAYDNSEITNSYSRATVTGEQDGIGGLIGNLNSSTVINSYSTGSVTNNENPDEAYGLIGKNNGGTVTNSYWDAETSGQLSSEGGTGLATHQMKNPNTFNNWDFVAVWGMDASVNDGYPVLRAVNFPNVITITGSEGWRMMTSPANDVSYRDLLDDLWLQGMADGDYTGGSPNIYTWSESSQDFQAVTDATTKPGTGTGFIVYVYDDQDYDGTPEGFPKSMQIEGARHSGSFSPSLSYTDTDTPDDDGWNLVGNPYGSAVDWGSTHKSNLDDSFYIWNDADGEYQSHNGTTGTLPSDYIAPWQGFWIKASAASPQLTIEEDAQVSGGSFLKKQPVAQLRFEIKKGSADSLSALRSQTIVMFSGRAAIGKDRLDSWKLQPLNEQYLSLYTTDTERHALDINALPIELESPLEVNLDFKGSDLGGAYTLKWNPQDLPESWTEGSVKLTDLHMDRILNLNKAGEYSFEVEGEKAKTSKSLDQASMFDPPQHGPVPTVLKAKTTNPRFVLSVNPNRGGDNLTEIPEETELAQNYPNPFNPETVIRYGVPEQVNVQLNVYDVLGRKVQTLINEQKSAGRYEASFNASELASGLYFYRLEVGAEVLTKKMVLIK